jgi:hypothetical protein
MSLSEEILVGLIAVDRRGFVRVRTDTIICRDGVPIGEPSYHSRVLAPGDDLTYEPPDVVAHARAAWTPERVKAEIVRCEALRLAASRAEPSTDPDHKEPAP